MSCSARLRSMISNAATHCSPPPGITTRNSSLKEPSACSAREFGNDSGPVLGMNTANQVFEPEHIVLANAKQKTQTRVGPEVTAFQIAHHSIGAACYSNWDSGDKRENKY